MAKHHKLKDKLRKKENQRGKKKSSQKTQTKNINKTSKKKEVITKNDKVSSLIKEKVKKVMMSNEKPKRVKKTEKTPRFTISQSDKTKLKENEDFFERKTIGELKLILKQNNQVCSGTKNVLTERCAQGKLWGALPNCPICFGGKLRFNIKTGEYLCPGYMNDTDFVFCKYRVTDGVLRNPWRE